VADPQEIQREIEETRAELARTIDALADRMSPRRAAVRGAQRLRSGVQSVWLHEASPDGQAPAGTAVRVYQSELVLRKERVAIAVGAVVAVTALVVLLRRRR
jgi:hypothetical protein